MSKKKIVEVYQSKSKNQDWRWRIRAPNGNIIGSSSEGFTTSAGAKRNLKTLTASLAVAEVEIVRPKTAKTAAKLKNVAKPKAPRATRDNRIPLAKKDQPSAKAPAKSRAKKPAAPKTAFTNAGKAKAAVKSAVKSATKSKKARLTVAA